jgi:hypothetical protein
MNSPLMVVLIRVGSADDTGPYIAHLRPLLVEGNQSTGPRELLQPAELREFVQAGSQPPVLDCLSSADRALIVILDAAGKPPGNPDEPSLGTRCLETIDHLPNRPAAFVIEVYLKEPGPLYDGQPGRRILRLGLSDLDERDLRAHFLGLYTLHHAHNLLIQGTAGQAANSCKIFFSHAKRDGVPLTTAARDWLKRIKGFETYYDTENLDLSGDIEQQLAQAVESAIIIVFRSEIYDERYWCQKEVLWSEEYARPVLTVDARWQIEHAPSLISFDSTPVVRIPDGNVARIFLSALTEALRVELFKARVRIYAGTISNPSVVAVPRCPSLVALYQATEALRAGTTSSQPVIVYPNPSLPKSMLTAANELAGSRVPGASVLSLDEFRLVC